MRSPWISKVAFPSIAELAMWRSRLFLSKGKLARQSCAFEDCSSLRRLRTQHTPFASPSFQQPLCQARTGTCYQEDGYLLPGGSQLAQLCVNCSDVTPLSVVTGGSGRKFGFIAVLFCLLESGGRIMPRSLASEEEPFTGVRNPHLRPFLSAGCPPSDTVCIRFDE